MSRTFNTIHREEWNKPIHQILKAIDNHNRLYLETGNIWHNQKAEILRSYVSELKTWIHREEKNH